MRGILASGARSWWFTPMPLARLAWVRTILYGFLFVDVLITTSWISMHANTPPELYRPLWLARALPLPVPGPVVVPAVMTALLLCAVIALSGRLPRLAGAGVFIFYLHWMLIAFSYGKVNHDRFALLVALAVLPTGGPASHSDTGRGDAAGWAIRCIQVAVVATYFLSAFAKLRYGGIEWLDGSTLMRGVLRRGTGIGDELRYYPALLHAAQYGIVVFELASPLLFAKGLVGRAFLALAGLFHLVTWAALKITFLPHTVCLLAFLPLEWLPKPSLSPWSRSGPMRARSGER